MPLQSVFVVSLPRSGSTVLTNLLDGYEDVVCPPESFFPAVLELLDESEMSDKRKIAGLFVVSCSDGSPLTLDEAEECIYPSKHATLNALALAISAKLGRDPDKIRTVVWKFTRMVGQWQFAAVSEGRFIILRRNLLNVYESQFRVPFGAKNRNPLRFALFAASYEVAFGAYPVDRVLALDYAEIPSRLEEIARWIRSSGERRPASPGTLDGIAGKQPWHANINKPFDNRDGEKLRNLTMPQRVSFQLSLAILKQARFLTRKARHIADLRQMAALRDQANALLKTT
jgi:hypothetical protein